MAALRAEVCLWHFSQGSAAFDAVFGGGRCGFYSCGCDDGGRDANGGDGVSRDRFCDLHYGRLGSISIVRVMLEASGLGTAASGISVWTDGIVAADAL